MSEKSQCKMCGKCCVNLSMKASPDELKNAYDHYILTGVSKIYQVHLIYPMLIFKHDKGGGFYEYRCKHISREGLCTIYDIRPDMCKDFPFYPDGVKVELHEGCGYTGRIQT